MVLKVLSFVPYISGMNTYPDAVLHERNKNKRPYSKSHFSIHPIILPFSTSNRGDRKQSVSDLTLLKLSSEMNDHNEQYFQNGRKSTIPFTLEFRPRWNTNFIRHYTRFFGKYDNNTDFDQHNSKKSENSRDDDNYLPAWIKALFQWEPPGTIELDFENSNNTQEAGRKTNFFPFSTTDMYKQKVNREVWDEEMSPLVASISGMVNVEALMAAASDLDESTFFRELNLLSENGKSGNFSATIEAGKGDIFASRSDDTTVNGTSDSISDRKLLPFLEGALSWETFVPMLQKNVRENTDLRQVSNLSNLNTSSGDIMKARKVITEDRPSLAEMVKSDSMVSSPSFKSLAATENILRDATQRLEFLINGTSSAFSPSTLQDLIIRASKALTIQEASGNLTAAAYAVFQAAGKAPRATAQYTAELVQFANEVLAGGYVRDDAKSPQKTKVWNIDSVATTTRPLFDNFPSVRNIPPSERKQVISKAAEFASLSGAIYENTIPITHDLGHTVVAQGKTSGIAWMITDSIQYERDFWSQKEKSASDPVLVRTFLIRGYDASDEEIDREGLLNDICTAAPTPIRNNEKFLVKVHEGMLSIAEDLLQEFRQFIDLTSPQHRFIFSGHSIGGSLSVLILFLLANNRGANFVRDRVLRVFTFGSPPIVSIEQVDGELLKEVRVKETKTDTYSCSVLNSFGLPTGIVYGYNQPWDPIIRLFSKFDPLYPLIDDLGEDGVTLYASGPNRALRPITKAILESWEGWPRYRDNARVKLGQNYRSIGQQYIFLPEPIRYLTDRLVSVNTAVPPIDTILQISSRDLLPALNEVFTLDTFTISYIPVAIRSFVHHFYPAYSFPFVDFVARQNDPPPSEKDDVSQTMKKNIVLPQPLEVAEPGIEKKNGVDWAGAAAQLVLGVSINQESQSSS